MLIPVYNNKNGLAKTLQSINGINVLIYDDGSAESERMPLAELRAMCPNSVVKIIQSDENKGIAWARNSLINECLTPYGCFLDAGDCLLSPDYMISGLNLMISEPDVLVIGCWAVSETGIVKSRPVNPSLAYFIYRDPVVTSGSILSVGFSKRISFVDPTTRRNFAEDYYFFFRLRRFGKIINFPSIAILREDRAESLINSLPSWQRFFFAIMVRVKIMLDLAVRKRL